MTEQTEDLGKNAADGGYCRLVQRRCSARLSPVLARRFGPNAITLLDLVVGLAAAAAILIGQPLVAAVLVQAFGVLSCVDGEVARLRNETSSAGDVFDTMTDRIVEVALIVAITAALAGELGQPALWTGFLLCAGVLLLVVSSEKFRSAYGSSYPKARWERLFGWISAGSDARTLMLTVALVLLPFAGAWTALTIVGLLAVVTYANIFWRGFVFVTRLPSYPGSGWSGR